MKLESKSEGETRRIAARLAKGVRGGSLILLSGPLGAGKTTFVRGFLRALGHRGVVRSPTFALVHEYPRLKPRVYHLDLYRIDPGGAMGLALEEYLEDGGAASLIEWPEAGRRLYPRDRLEIALSHARRGRTLRLRALGARAREMLKALKKGEA